MLVSGGNLVLSDTTPAFARQNYYANTGLNLTAMHATYGALYRAQLWVFVVVSKRARATARLPLKVYSRAAAGRSPAGDSAYGRLLANPNPKHDPFFFWLWTSSTYDVYGEAMWAKIRNRAGVPVELWPMHPSLMQIRMIPNEATGESEMFYAYLGGMAASVPVMLIPAEDVVHFRAYNPDTTVRGMSSLEPLRQTLVNEDAARRATSAFWANGARPGTVLSHPGELSDAAAQRLKKRWDQLAGGTDRTGSTMILEEGMKAERVTLTAEEAQYIDTRKLNREEVCAAYDVPPPVVHILDRATFSNITEQMRSMYRDTMAPHLGSLEATMDAHLRPDFGDESLYAEFLMEEVLRGAFEQRSESYQRAINAGWMKPSEVRQLENLPDAGKSSDQLFINSAIIPIDATSSRTSPTPPAVDDPTGAHSVPPANASPGLPAPAKSITGDQARSVLGRLGRAKSLADVDPVRIVAGLNGESDTVLAAMETAGSIDDLRARIKALVTPEGDAP